MFTDVLIVGAGPVGLTLALVLARLNVKVRVVDKNEARVQESRATDVHARTLELFSTIAVVEPVLARGKRAHTVNFYNSCVRIARYATSALDTPYPFIVDIPQSATEEILEDALAEQPIGRSSSMPGRLNPANGERASFTARCRQQTTAPARQQRQQRA